MLATISFLTLTLTAPVPALDLAALKKEQDAGWADLAKDERTASRALLKFSSRPVEAVKYFATALKPLTIDREKVKRLIHELASADEKIWKPAFEAFEYFDPRLALSLQNAFDEAPKGLSQQRLVCAMSDWPADSIGNKPVKLRPIDDEQYNFTADGGSWNAEPKVSRIGGPNASISKRLWTRAERAIVLLEHFGTPEAFAVLKSMATGHAEAAPTVAAKESLKRLKAE